NGPVAQLTESLAAAINVCRGDQSAMHRPGGYFDMTSPTPDLETRLYGMMQHVMAASANRAELSVPSDRGVVTKQDALDAVLQLAAAIDEPAQNGTVPAEIAKWQGSLLMVVREYIEPLPPGMGADPNGGESDHFTKDLEQLVRGLREGGDRTGVRG
ncbi:MAG TPA: hypothetical protein VGM75_30075, partial [Pseudonocardiaceae bacterium]